MTTMTAVRRRQRTNLLVFACCCVGILASSAAPGTTDAFAVVQRQQRQQQQHVVARPTTNKRRTAFTTIGASLIADKSETTVERRTPTAPSKTESLVFGADLTYTSEPFVVEGDNNENEKKNSDGEDVLAAFLKRPETKQLLFGAGGRRKTTLLELTPELVELWMSSCEAYYGPTFLPEPGDEVVAAETVVKFPGLTVTSLVCNGVKMSSDERGLPQYDCVLIGEQRQVNGPAPLVWVYNQLTGAASRNYKEGEFHPSEASAKTKVSVVTEDDGASYALACEMNGQVRVEFPKLLIRILPASKRTMEERGSASVLKTMRNDVVDGIDAVRESFLMFCKRRRRDRDGMDDGVPTEELLCASSFR